MKKNYLELMQINPKEVRLWTLDILKWAVRLKGEFTLKDVGKEFDLTPKQSWKRVSKLRSWGMVKTIKKSLPKTYGATDWGRKFLEDQKLQDK